MEDMKNYAYTLFRTIPSDSKCHLFYAHKVALSQGKQATKKRRTSAEILRFVK